MSVEVARRDVPAGHAALQTSGAPAAAALVLLVGSLAAFHHLPAFLPGRLADWVDLVTPFAVVAAFAAAFLTLRAQGRLLVVAGVAAIAYVDGHGIHLAANSIAHEAAGTAAAERTHFWDEEFGHLEWHLGLVVLLAALAAAGNTVTLPRARLVVAWTGVVLGFTLFTSGVEGGTWPLMLAASTAIVAYAVRARTATAAAVAAAFATAAVLAAVWAVWQGGMPQFSEVGLL